MIHLPLLVVALTLLSPSSSAASDSTYNTFVQCMQKKTNDNKISGVIYAQTNPSYTSVLRAYIRNARFNTTTTKKPALIFTPKSETQVPPAIFCANATGLRLKTRSGGHDYAGVSYVDSVPFLIVDMFALSSVSVDLKTSTAWVGAGATLGEVYYGIWKLSKSLGFPAGVCPTVGVGGHISGGGYGNMIRKYGLAVDHVLDARIVDVNGNILDRKSMGEDLFWAIRGGGGASFGVILAYKIGLVPVPSTVTVFEAERILDQDKDMTDFVHQWQTAAPTTNDGLFMRMLIQPITSKVNKKQKTVRSTVVAFFLGKADELVSTLAKDFPLLRLKKENVTEMTWVQSILWWANIDEKSPETVLLDRKLDAAIFGYRKSDYVQKPISKEGLAALWKKVVEQGKVGLVFNPYGGRMNQVPEGASPFPHRAGNLFKMQYSISWREPGAAAEANATTQIRNLYSFMTPFVSKNPRSSFLNYRDLDIGVNSFGPNSYKEGRVYGLKYFGAKNFDRLVKIKTAVDPQNFFKSEQSIPTLPQKA